MDVNFTDIENAVSREQRERFRVVYDGEMPIVVERQSGRIFVFNRYAHLAFELRADPITGVLIDAI